MTIKERWDSQTPEQRREGLKYLLINTTLLKVNQCSSIFNEIGFLYSAEMETYQVFKIQYDEPRNMYFIFSKIID
jgi:hypothetical protein